MWIENQNDGKMWAHGTGMKAIFGTVSLNPTSPIAMDGNRYPITEIGLLNLVERLLIMSDREEIDAEQVSRVLGGSDGGGGGDDDGMSVSMVGQTARGGAGSGQSPGLEGGDRTPIQFNSTWQVPAAVSVNCRSRWSLIGWWAVPPARQNGMTGLGVSVNRWQKISAVLRTVGAQACWSSAAC